MRRMGPSCPSAMKPRVVVRSGAHARHSQVLTQVQVRSPRSIPATETSQRCEIFLLVPRMCKSLVVLGYVARAHPDRELDPRFHTDVAGRRLR